MKKLLLLTGDLACGKTTFARILSQRYDVPLFFKDSIKECLGDIIGFSNREENLKLSKGAVAVMTMIFEEFAPQGKDLILEANFRTHELESLHSIAERCGYKVLTLQLWAEIPLLHKRYLHRIAHENRHPVHIISVLDDPKDFAAYIEQARTEQIPGRVLRVNADDFSYQTDETLLGLLDEFMLG